MFANIGYTEVLIILAVLILLFGGSKLPLIAKNLGKSGKDLKKANKELNEAITEKPAKKD
jgi:sec-independent protein translocase protein TatA